MRSGKWQILLNDEHHFEMEPGAISENALENLMFEEVVRSITGLPNTIDIAEFAVRDENDVASKIKIETLADILRATTTYDSPLFVLHTVPNPPRSSNQMRSTTNHPMILLEPYVSELSPQAAESARTYFDFLQMNSRLSHQTLKELDKLLMPLKPHNDELWNRGMMLQQICDASRKDIAKILQLDSYVARLNERDAAVARLDLDIVRKGYPLAKAALQELVDLFSPTGRVNAEHWDKTLLLKEVFDTISATEN